MSEADEARSLGIAFVRAYYGALASGKPGQEPKEWLSADSVWTSGAEGVEPAEQSHVKGRENISMQTEFFRAQQVELSVVDSQFGVEGGLFVMACGSVKDPNQTEAPEPRRFIQSFFLSKEGDGYSIRNCILRFLSAPFPVERAAPAPAEKAPAPKAAEAPKEPEPTPAPAPTPAPVPKKEEPAPAPKAAAEPETAKKPVAEPKATKQPEPTPEPVGKPKSFLDALSRPSKKAAHPPRHVKKAPPKPADGPKKSAGAHSSSSSSSSSSGSSSGETSGPPLTHHNLQAQCYVSNIPFDATNVQLRNVLGKFGAIRTIVRPVNKGYGFLEFEKDADADRAIAETARNPIILNNRRLNIEKRTGKESVGSGNNKPRRGRGGRGGRGRGGPNERGDRDRKK